MFLLDLQKGISTTNTLIEQLAKIIFIFIFVLGNLLAIVLKGTQTKETIVEFPFWETDKHEQWAMS